MCTLDEVAMAICEEGQRQGTEGEVALPVRVDGLHHPTIAPSADARPLPLLADHVVEDLRPRVVRQGLGIG